MTQPLPGKTRCSTDPSANAIKSSAKYTCRFMLLMATLIGQIECYKFQQQTDDLPPNTDNSGQALEHVLREADVWTEL